MKDAFAHASHARAEAEAIIVIMRAGDRVGYGEIQPRTYVTGESYPGVLAVTGPALAQRWLATEIDEPLAFLRAELDRAGRDLALMAGFELALLDVAGVPLATALGGEPARAPLPGGVILGFEVETADLPKRAAMLRLGGRTHIKVKVGRDDDEARLRAISKVLPDVALRLDANEAWSTDEAIARLRSFAGVPIASIEQPVPAGDLAGLRRVRLEAGVPVMADESLCSLDDARRLIAAEAVDVFHIRIAKMGGLLGARRMVEEAQRHGLEVHLGTMVGETGILSRAAEVFGRLVPGFACLDGKAQNERVLSADLLDEPAAARDAPLDAPGLGVTISPERLDRFGVGPRVGFTAKGSS
jgi:muconate cycloisomerase